MRKKLKTLLCTVLATAFLLTNTGCSVFRPHKQTVNVTCFPEDAVLMVNGQRYHAPTQIRVKRDQDVSIQAYKDGYTPYQRTIGHSLNTTGILDVVGTLLILVPCVGLLTPGAWSLDETNVGITLFEK